MHPTLSKWLSTLELYCLDEVVQNKSLVCFWRKLFANLWFEDHQLFSVVVCDIFNRRRSGMSFFKNDRQSSYRKFFGSLSFLFFILSFESRWALEPASISIAHSDLIGFPNVLCEPLQIARDVFHTHFIRILALHGRVSFEFRLFSSPKNIPKTK